MNDVTTLRDYFSIGDEITKFNEGFFEKHACNIIYLKDSGVLMSSYVDSVFHGVNFQNNYYGNDGVLPREERIFSFIKVKDVLDFIEVTMKHHNEIAALLCKDLPKATKVASLSNIDLFYLDVLLMITTGNRLLFFNQPFENMSMSDINSAIHLLHSLAQNGYSITLVTKQLLIPEYDNILFYYMDDISVYPLTLVNQDNKNHIEVKNAKGTSVYLILDEILYFESVTGITSVMSKRGNFTLNLRLYDIEALLKNNGFMRVHRSFIVRLSAIESIETVSTNVYTISFYESELKIPVSRNQIGALRSLLKGFKS